MSYFSSVSGQVVPRLGTAGSPSLRRAQLGAAWAVGSHFTLATDPGLVVMPTGSGKTAVMTLVPYLLLSERVLVIAPSTLVRDQAAREFASLAVLRAAGTLTARTVGPRVKVVRHQLRTEEDWNELRSFDVIVGTPHCVSPEMQGVSTPPDDVFDLVVIDEAHHAAAVTWAALLRCFPNARKVLFTATPFRRDQKTIPGTLVYLYTLGQAMSDEIYQPIDFIPIDVALGQDKDAVLAAAAAGLLHEPSHAQARSKLLIRTDSLAKADALEATYKDAGIEVGVVNSRKSLRTNQAVINRVVANELQGLISVGVLGEGFDLPQLKIAVYHDRHKSLPATLQFVGRIARTNPAQFKSAHLLAVREDVMDETRELYDQDAHWARLIPKLSEAAIEREQERRAYLEQFKIPEDLSISPHVLVPRPYARIYSGDTTNIDLSNGVEFETPYRVIYDDTDDDKRLLALITVRMVRPAWIDSNVLDFPQYDLHLVFVDRERHLLFVYSPTDATYRQLLRAIGADVLRPVAPSAINSVLSTYGIREYFSVGLKSARATGPRQPSYKMMAGRQVHGSVTASDGRGFVLGHAIATYDDAGVSESLGVSVAKSKVWSIKSGSLLEFREWCERVADAVSHEGGTVRVPMMPLRVPERLVAFPSHPIGFVWDSRAFSKGAALEHEGVVYSLAEVDVEVTRSDDLNCTFTFITPDGELLGTVRFTVGEPLTCVGTALLVESRSHAFDAVPMHEFLEQYSPIVYFADGSAVFGQQLARVPQVVEPIANLTRWNWEHTDIRNEASVTSAGILNVQDTAIQHATTVNPGTIVIRDHGTHEIADVISIAEIEQDIEVELIHCKGSSEAAPGVRVDDLYEVCGQAVRSIRWAQSGVLLTTLVDHLERRQATTVVSAHEQAQTLDKLRALLASGARVGVRVTIVQPGVDLQRAGTSQNINIMLSSCSEWLADQDIVLKIVGS